MDLQIYYEIKLHLKFIFQLFVIDIGYYIFLSGYINAVLSVRIYIAELRYLYYSNRQTKNSHSRLYMRSKKLLLNIVLK